MSSNHAEYITDGLPALLSSAPMTKSVEVGGRNGPHNIASRQNLTGNIGDLQKATY